MLIARDTWFYYSLEFYLMRDSGMENEGTGQSTIGLTPLNCHCCSEEHKTVIMSGRQIEQLTEIFFMIYIMSS